MVAEKKQSIKIKGTVLRARLEFVREISPFDGLDRVLNALGQKDRQELIAVQAIGWYPFELGRRLDEAIVQVLGKGKPDFFEKIGAASAQKNLTGVHKSFLTPGDPQAFLSKAPMIYSFYYDQGRRDYRKLGPKEASLTTFDADTFSIADCATVVGWYRHALRMCGAVNPRIIEEECRARGGNVCRYRISWD